MEKDLILGALAEHFPKDEVHWRAQTLTKNHEKALALAYLDARHVETRLDAVMGLDWQCETRDTDAGKACGIGLRIDGEWIWRWDGASDTAIESEKGGYSDAFKRAGVKWGIGRYLYGLGATWVPCETFNNKFSKFTEDPWKYANMIEKLPEHFSRGVKFWLDVKDYENCKGQAFADLPDSLLEKMHDSRDNKNLSASKKKAAQFAGEEIAIRIEEAS